MRVISNYRVCFLKQRVEVELAAQQVKYERVYRNIKRDFRRGRPVEKKEIGKVLV